MVDQTCDQGIRGHAEDPGFETPAAARDPRESTHSDFFSVDDSIKVLPKT